MGYREKAYELARSLMNTEEYKKLLKAKKEVDANSDLRKKIIEYSKKQASIFSGANPGKLQEQLMRLNNEYSRLSSHPEARNYFERCREFNSLMARTYRIVNDILDSGMQ